MKRLIFFLIIAISSSAISKEKIAVLPFSNFDGDLKHAVWCYDLQDSLYKAMKEADPNGELFELIPIEEIEDALAELNVDPTNPQYKSDMWKAAKQLGATQVVSGNFNFQASKYLINAYIYDTRFKFPDPKYQAKDIFKAEESIYESIEIILEALLPKWKS